MSQRNRRTRIGRRQFLTLAGLGAAGLAAPRLYGARGPARKPNIVVIVADDLGYADIGCHGCTDIPTPHIDSLAANGVRFTDGYVSCPVCSPTRAGLMTGRYQQRFGHEYNTGAPPQGLQPNVGLPLTETTLADRLKALGYATGIVGKWHLGMAPHFHPFRRGFDEFFGFLHGGHAYLESGIGTWNPVYRGETEVDEQEYLTDAFTREAVAFIERHRVQPFLLYLTYNAVHTPMEAVPKYTDRFANIADERRRTHAAMLSAMDDGIGAVLGRLQDVGVEQDTLVFFISDNGGPEQANGSINDPLRQGKATMYEGGIRVPFILQWPRRLPAGQVYRRPAIALDILPTAVAAAGGRLRDDAGLDGVNLLPYATGNDDDAPHASLFWRMGPNAAMRRGRWKLVRRGDAPPELYDLAADAGETTDLAADKPKLLEQLSDALAGWESQLVEPVWGTPIRPRASGGGRVRRRRQPQ